MDDVFASEKLNKAWYFVNSSLFLWAMSSIVLALATWGYTSWSEARDARLATETRIAHLKNEIKYRLDEDILHIIFDDSSPNGGIISINTANMMCNISNVSSETLRFSKNIEDSVDYKLRMLTDRFVYTDSKDRSIYSLLWELKSILPDESDRLSKAIASLAELRKAAYSGDQSRPISSYFENVRDLVRGWTIA